MRAQDKAANDAAAKRQKQENAATEKKAKQDEKINMACRKLCSTRAKRDAAKLAIPDLKRTSTKRRSKKAIRKTSKQIKRA